MARNLRTVRARIFEADGSTREIEVIGRVAQALVALVEAGQRGTTALTVGSWALRYAAHIFKLRKLHGLQISTEREPHGGPYEGTHGLYRLHDRCEIVFDSHAEDQRHAA